MKTKKTSSAAIKGFKVMEFVRDTRDKISQDIQGMTPEEILKYFEERRKSHQSAKESALTPMRLRGRPQSQSPDAWDAAAGALQVQRKRNFFCGVSYLASPN